MLEKNNDGNKTNNAMDKKVELMKKFFSDSMAKNHPIQDHPISKTDEYVRNLYIDMLCMVAQYECNDTERGFSLIRRIMSACENTLPLEEYIKHSMEITTEKTAEFIKQCKDNKLCEIFMIDAMLLSCANGTPNAKQVGFIAQFGDMLGFDKDKISDVAKFVLAILEQDTDKYQEILNNENEAIQLNAICYAKEFVCGLIICTSKKMHFYSQKLAKYDLPLKDAESYLISTMDEVKFENLIINDIGKLKLITIKNVTFENCHCLRGSLYLESIDKVTINKCVFKWVGEKNERPGDYSINRAISANLENCQLTVTNTSFSNYEVKRYDTSHYYMDSWYYTGAVLYNQSENDTNNQILFDNCNFSNIHTAQSESGRYGNDAILKENDCFSSVMVTNCHFSNCTCDRSNNCLFYAYNVEQDNNTLVNSNPLYN